MENKSWILKSRPNDENILPSFKLETSSLPPIAGDEFLVRVDYISCDPSQRIWMSHDSYVPAAPIGQPMPALGLGTVITSGNARFPEGVRVIGMLGWQHYFLGTGLEKYPLQIVPEDVPPEIALSLFGNNGLAAYFGLIHHGLVQNGETVVITSAAGATGTIACQLARMRGARVLGIAGSDDKCQWLKENNCVDETINYKKEKLSEKLKLFSPNGFDLCFDNVGGKQLDEILLNMKRYGRIVCCGAISTYNRVAEPPAVFHLPVIVSQRLSLKGFIYFDHAAKFHSALADLRSAYKKGAIKFRTDIRQEFEQMPQTFSELFSGTNRGKLIVKVHA